MARLATVGFESQRLASSGATSGENSGTNTVVSSGTVSMDTSTVRSGACAASMAQNAANYVEIASAPSTLDRAYYLRGYFRFTDATPSAAATIIAARANSVDVVVVKLSTAGKLQLFDSNGAQVGSDHPTVLADNTWYRVELAFAIPTAGNTGSASLYVDGTVGPANLAGLDLNNSVASGVIRLGNVSGGQAGVTTYLDDVALNDAAAGGTQTSYPGSGRILLAKPISDSAVGTGWEQPKTTGSDTTALYDSLDNMPPSGVAHSDADANNLKYIFNANSSVPSSYDANVQDYTTAGMESGGRVRFCYVLDRHGSSGSATNDGQIKLVSNPADSGATSINFKAAGVAGTDPTNWQTKVGGRVYDPSVTAGTQPVVRVTKSSATTDAAMVDLLGVLFEYDVPIRPTLTAGVETGAAQTLSASKPIHLTLDVGSESGAAQTLSVTKPIHVSLGVAAEGASAVALVATKPIHLTLAPATEAGAAQAVTATKPIQTALTAAGESGTAQALSVTQTHYRDLTAATETGEAQALSLTHVHYRDLGSAVETDSAAALTFSKPIHLTLGPAVEVGEAQALAVSGPHVRDLGPAVEADTAQGLSYAKPVHVSLGAAGEADAASALASRKALGISSAGEIDVAADLAISRPHVRALVAAEESDNAGSLGFVETIPAIGRVTLTLSAPASLGLATVSTVALAHESRGRAGVAEANHADLDEHPTTDLELTLA